MAVDRHGDITLPIRSEMQPAFSPVVACVVDRLHHSFPALIHSLYVYGSVAEGRAKIGKSDLDMTLIFNHQPEQETKAQLAAVQSELEQHNPAVSKIDFDCGLLQQVLHPGNQLSWGYWLRHHCVCVYGEDLSRRFQPFKPSKAIAVAVNGDFLTVLERLIAEMDASVDPNKQLQLQRAAARKIIRATSILRGEQDADWPDTLQQHRIKFIARYPALTKEMDYLMAIAHQPEGNIRDFQHRVRVFAEWLSATFHRQQG